MSQVERDQCDDAAADHGDPNCATSRNDRREDEPDENTNTQDEREQRRQATEPAQRHHGRPKDNGQQAKKEPAVKPGVLVGHFTVVGSHHRQVCPITFHQRRLSGLIRKLNIVVSPGGSSIAN